MGKSVHKAKQLWKPGTMLAPVPSVMVTCCDKSEKKLNIITVCWVGTVCSEPPMVSISVRPERFSYALIEETKEFCINIPSKNLAAQTDMCGVISGKNYDKFHESGLTPYRADTVKAPIILECPINIECKIKQQIELGSHVMFLAEITSVQVDKNLITQNGKLNLNRADLLCYAHGGYYKLGKQIGTFGFSVKKK